jgi:hypothetical protein
MPCGHDVFMDSYNHHGNATVKQDEYGFWLMVNHGQKVPRHVEPYMFP